MSLERRSRRRRPTGALMLIGSPVLLGLSGCATVGKLMSPYSENFSCKNDDHGQCIDPQQAYADAVAGRASRSDPAVTADAKLLRDQRSGKSAPKATPYRSGSMDRTAAPAFAGYRDSVYRELQGLVDQPVTPMLKSPRTVRTLILPYADRQRPDRLYMPRFVYSILDAPAWVVGDYLVDPVSPAVKAPVLGQVRERPGDTPAASLAAEPKR